jgi:hypothetical protein
VFIKSNFLFPECASDLLKILRTAASPTEGTNPLLSDLSPLRRVVT